MPIAGLTHKPGKPGLRARDFGGAQDFEGNFFLQKKIMTVMEMPTGRTGCKKDDPISLCQPLRFKN